MRREMTGERERERVTDRERESFGVCDVFVSGCDREDVVYMVILQALISLCVCVCV